MDYSSQSRQGAGLTLPSIANILPPPQPSNEDTRDSGSWSAAAQSRHTSSSSNNGNLHLTTILNNDGPSNRYPFAGTPRTVRPPSQSVLPAINQSFPSNQPFNNNNRNSVDTSNSFVDSRRSSVDSTQINAHLNQMNINVPGTYDSNNGSRVSLVSNLQRERGIVYGPRNGSSPLSPRRPSDTGSHAAPRRAPAILANPRPNMPNPTASTPTRGYPWAFPDSIEENEHDDMDGSDDSLDSSRRESLIGSINTDIHGHSMPTSRVSTLQGADALAAGNYSRTPELRVSHKLAERKRRLEMKDLFEQLHRVLPSPPGTKQSKWEVLAKAIDYIGQLKQAFNTRSRQMDAMDQEISRGKAAIEDNRLLQNEITAMYQQLLRVDPSGHHIFGPRTQFLAHQESQTPTAGRLAPLQQAPPPQPHWPSQSSGGMQGIEYGSHSHYVRS